MTYLTRGGVAYDLNKSPYLYNVVYDDCYISYYFSSEFYLNKFKQKLEDNRLSINQSLSNRFGISVDLKKLCDLKLYSVIEKRGFLVRINGKENIDCLNNLLLNGEVLIEKN